MGFLQVFDLYVENRKLVYCGKYATPHQLKCFFYGMFFYINSARILKKRCFKLLFFGIDI